MPAPALHPIWTAPPSTNAPSNHRYNDRMAIKHFRSMRPDELQIQVQTSRVRFPRDVIGNQMANCAAREWEHSSRSVEFKTDSKQVANFLDRVPVEGFVDAEHRVPNRHILHVVGGEGADN